MDTQNVIAFIPSAGLGTRLGDETKNIPKALVDIHSQPMIYWVLQKIRHTGISEIVINVHHHANILIDWLTDYQKKNPNIHIHLSLEIGKLLDTGGALKKARPLLKNFPQILVHNVDIFSDVALFPFLAESLTQKYDVLLLVTSRQTHRYLLFDQSMRLCGWENRITGPQILTRENKKALKPLAFSGIYTMNSELLSKTPIEDVFSVIPWFLHLTKTHKVYGIKHDVTRWYDAGKPPSLKVLREMDIHDFKQMTE